MTTYYSEGVFGVVSFETDPHHDINADAKFWSPDTERWVDCPGSTGIGTDVLYSVDFYPIPADAVEEMQTRCRDLMARRAAPGSTSGYTPRPRPSRRGDGTLPIRASEPLAREATVPMTTSYKEAFGIVSFETDPQTDINADAKCWHPASDEWVDCPGSTGIGVGVLWSGDYTQIPAASVPEMQQRCRDLSNVRRRGDTESWPPRRPLRHERGRARSPNDRS